MANKLENILGIFKNAKSRTIFFVTIGIIIFGLIVAIHGLHRAGLSDDSNASASLSEAPQISGNPDILGNNVVSQQRAKLTTRADNTAVWKAATQGKSALPTSFGQPVSLTGQNLNENKQPASSSSDSSSGQGNASASLNRILGSVTGAQEQGGKDHPSKSKQYSDPDQAIAREEAQADAQAARLQAQINSEDGSDNGVGGDLSSAMSTEVKQLLASWNPTAQELVEAKQTQPNGQTTAQTGSIPANQSNIKGAGAGGAGTSGPPLFKAGTILFGVLQTSVNTDSPGPIMATIEVGPYKGAKLLGSLQPAGRYAKGVTLKFSNMTLPQYQSAISVTAYAIDPNTARTALATGVDHHYLLRYGTLIASSFLSGMGQAVALSNQTITNSPLGGSTQAISLNSTGDQALYAAGTVGQKLGDEFGRIYNRPTTITIDSGTGIGILYMQDVPTPLPDQEIQTTQR